MTMLKKTRPPTGYCAQAKMWDLDSTTDRRSVVETILKVNRAHLINMVDYSNTVTQSKHTTQYIPSSTRSIVTHSHQHRLVLSEDGTLTDTRPYTSQTCTHRHHTGAVHTGYV